MDAAINRFNRNALLCASLFGYIQEGKKEHWIRNTHFYHGDQKRDLAVSFPRETQIYACGRGESLNQRAGFF